MSINSLRKLTVGMSEFPDCEPPVRYFDISIGLPSPMQQSASSIFFSRLVYDSVGVQWKTGTSSEFEQLLLTSVPAEVRQAREDLERLLDSPGMLVRFPHQDPSQVREDLDNDFELTMPANSFSGFSSKTSWKTSSVDAHVGQSVRSSD